jgi:uncharacterized membrane protein
MMQAKDNQCSSVGVAPPRRSFKYWSRLAAVTHEYVFQNWSLPVFFAVFSALWVSVAVELPRLFGADARWSMHIAPVAWLLHFHATCGVVALASGPLQFVGRIRRLAPRLHRMLGICYIVAIALAAPSAIVIALRLCKPAVALPAIAQAILWIIATVASVTAIARRNASQHGWWMARSYALTYTFVAGRMLVDVLHLHFPARVGGDAALTWILTLGALIVADLCCARRALHHAGLANHATCAARA